MVLTRIMHNNHLSSDTIVLPQLCTSPDITGWIFVLVFSASLTDCLCTTPPLIQVLYIPLHRWHVGLPCLPSPSTPFHPTCFPTAASAMPWIPKNGQDSRLLPLRNTATSQSLQLLAVLRTAVQSTGIGDCSSAALSFASYRVKCASGLSTCQHKHFNHCNAHHHAQRYACVSTGAATFPPVT